jgi:hypothetical protein
VGYAALYRFEIDRKKKHLVILCCVRTDEDRHDEHSYGNNITCNDECFNGLFKKLSVDTLSAGERRTQCQSLHSVAGSLMYSALCRNILSDLAEHRDAAAAAAGKVATKYREYTGSPFMSVVYFVQQQPVC